MIISLIHSPEVPSDFVDSVVGFLSEQTKVLRVQRLEGPSPERVQAELVRQGAEVRPGILGWSKTLDALAVLRDEFVEGESLMLLSDMPNERHFFAFGEAGLSCIHTAGWDMLIEGDRMLPVAHQVASNLLLDLAFGSAENALSFAHVEPRGCILDLCQNKREVQLKMRTADTCPECMQRFEDLLQRDRIKPNVLHEIWDVFDAVRSQLLHRERMRVAYRTSPIEIRGHRCQIWLLDYAQELRLRPQEHAIYLLFLRHKNRQPIAFHDLDEHVDALSEWHRVVSGNIELNAIRQSFLDLVNPADSQVSQKISRIRKGLADIVGKAHAHRYLWPSSVRGPRQINPDLEVVWPEQYGPN